MRILEYFSLPEQERAHWRRELDRADWSAARFMGEMLDNGTIERYCGVSPQLLLAADGDRLAGFCTLSETDEIDAPELSPWIGFVYTYPEYRGKRLSGRLIEHACGIAKAEGREAVYISTGHIGLYEKYGFEFLRTMPSKMGGEARVYVLKL